MLQDLRLRDANVVGEVWIVPAVQELLLGFVQSGFRSKEAGGILLGYRRGPHIEVVEASTPLPGDIRKRHRFERCDAGHQAFSDFHWKSSHGLITYVGDWHTHPERTPTPSPVDCCEWGKLKSFYCEPLVFLIIGTAEWCVEFEPVRWVVPSPSQCDGCCYMPIGL